MWVGMSTRREGGACGCALLCSLVDGDDVGEVALTKGGVVLEGKGYWEGGECSIE